MATAKKKTPAKVKRPRGEHPRSYGQRQEVIQGLLSGLPIETICQRLKISRSRLYQIRKGPHWEAEWADAQVERRDRVNNQLESLAGLALKVHLDIMQRADHREQLKAAEGILDRVAATQKTSKQQIQTTQVVDDFRGRSDEDLQYYVQNGFWPEEASDS